MMGKSIRFHKPARTIWQRMTIGDAIFLQFSTEEGLPEYYIRSTGRRVEKYGAEELIAEGALTPVGDGLFEGQSQCFEKTRADLPPEIADAAN